MIPENLLLQTGEIHLGYFPSMMPFLWSSLIVCALVLTGWIYTRTRILMGKNEMRKHLTLYPSLESKEFQRESARLLRNQLTYIYLPHRAYVHSLNELRGYITEDHILSIMELLEKSEYSGCILSESEKKDILSLLETLGKKIQTTK